jgi:hypothetical protein
MIGWGNPGAPAMGERREVRGVNWRSRSRVRPWRTDETEPAAPFQSAKLRDLMERLIRAARDDRDDHKP